MCDMYLYFILFWINEIFSSKDAIIVECDMYSNLVSYFEFKYIFRLG